MTTLNIADNNTVADVAFKVLAQHANAIRVEQVGPITAADFKLIVGGLDRKNFEEVSSALRAVTRDEVMIGIETTQKGEWTIPVTSNNPSPIEKPNLRAGDPIVRNPVAALARLLTDQGINFPGSERFISPERKM